jgi:pSer/pThr/pTyr-binding forkhead associated (FHA) protein
MAYELSSKGCKLFEVVKAIKDIDKDDFLLEVETPILLEVPTEGQLPVEFGGESPVIEGGGGGDPLETVKVRVSQIGGLRRTRNMDAAQVFLLEGEPCTLGRSDDCDVVLESEGVSRKHAQIVSGGGNWFLVDLASHNGSFVNKVKAAANERVALEERCNVWFGSFRGVFLSPENFFDLATMLAGR